MIAVGVFAVDLIKEGISSRIIARDTAITDEFYWEIYREALTKNLLFGFSWALMIGFCLFFAYRNGKTLFTKRRNAAEQDAAANP